MIKNLTKAAFVAAATLLFAQCANNSADNAAAAAAESQKLKSETTWILQSMKVDSMDLAVPTDTDVTISFLDSANLAGNGGCNYYFGSYSIGDTINSITLQPAGMTRMAGPNMEFEQQFIANMQNVTSYSLKDSTLTLCDSLGREIMILSQSKESPVVEEQTEESASENTTAE